MPFYGVIPSEVRSIIVETVESWPTDEVHILCSGNLTVESVLREAEKKTGRVLKIHSGDISLYSCAIGCLAAGRPLTLRLKEEYRKLAPWLEEYLADPIDAAATVVLLMDHAASVLRSKGHWGRVGKALRIQWPSIHEKTKERLKRNVPRLDGFTCMDAYDQLDTVPEHAGLVTYPPFRGSEKEYTQGRPKTMEDMIEWDRPSFEFMTMERFQSYLTKVVDRPHWITGSNVPMEQLADYETAYIKRTNRAFPIHVYSSAKRTHLVIPNQPMEPFNRERLSGDDEILHPEEGGQVGVIKLTEGQFSTLRSQYMNIGIIPGQAMLPMAVLVRVKGWHRQADEADNWKLAGVFAYNPPNAKFGVTSPMYLLSDFPVRPSRYRHLAKLVLIAALSSELRMMCEKAIKVRVLLARTTAFSRHPQSMKYRGVFNLVSRKKVKKGKLDALDGMSDYYDTASFELNYEAEIGKWTLTEGLALWMKRYGATT